MTAVIRPVITYGPVVWLPRTQLPTAKMKLQGLQRSATVATTGCIRSATSAALVYLLNLRPLDLVILQEGKAAALRLR